MLRFVHASDLHLGKRFGNLPEDIAGRLREARHASLDRLAEAAHAGGASTILLAGDTFDTETPTPALLDQALAAMAGHAGITWIVLPGNHDSLLADALWSRFRANAPGNVVVADRPEPIALGAEALVLPAPCTTRRPGRDLTEWFDGAPGPEGACRIGLAHGPIRSFSEEGGALDVLAPDRASRAGLDYLALGDWHGQMQIDPRTWYAGTPEPDRFKHGRPGAALLVAIAGPGAAPEVSPVETGRFAWQTLALDFLGDADAVARLESVLPDPRSRRDTLARIVLTGRLAIAERTRLQAALDAVAPQFGYCEQRDGELESLVEVTDLDAIDRGGALREAAEALRAQSDDLALAEPERRRARDALARLFTLASVAEIS